MSLICDAEPDVELQAEYDAKRGVGYLLLAERFTAVGAARQAVVEGQEGARFALRQALVDLSSCAREMASLLPAPQVHMAGRKQPRRR